MRASRVQLLDDVCDRLADARNLSKPALRDYGLQRNGERKQTVGGPRIGFSAERVAATKGAALSKLTQQGGDGRSVLRSGGNRRVYSLFVCLGWQAIGARDESCATPAANLRYCRR